jgi:hypothetical protein
MSANVVILGLTFTDRLAIRFPVSKQQLTRDCATKISFQLPPHAMPPTPRGVALRLLCAPNVAVEVVQGSAIIRVSGLSSTAARDLAQLSSAELRELSDDADWRAWVETGAASQPFGRPRVAVDDIALLGVLAGPGAPGAEEPRLQHRFVACSGLSSVSFSLLARHFLHSARALFEESCLMIWFGDDGAEFVFDDFSPAVIDQYARLFDNELSGRFCKLGNQHHRRRLIGPQGFFIFSRAGVEVAAESFVRQALAALTTVDAGNPMYTLAAEGGGTAVSLLAETPIACQSDNCLAITLIDASGCEFRDKHTSLWRDLVSLLQSATNVRLVSLFGCTLDHDQLIELAARTHSLQHLSDIMIGVKLYEKIASEHPTLFPRPSVLVPSSLSPAIEFPDEEARQLMRTRIDRIRGLLMLQRRRR